MDRVYLAEYGAREDDAIRRATSTPEALVQTKKLGYPPRARFANAGPSLTLAEHYDADSIWPQVPLSESLVIPLSPVRREWFERVHGFRPDVIEEAVTFSKDRGRILFALNQRPESFEGLEYLRPIFEDIRPPLMIHMIERDMDLHRRATAEFEAAAGISYFPRLRQICSEMGYPSSYLSEETSVYADLRQLKQDELADKILDSLIVNPNLSSRLMTIGRLCIVAPATNPLGAERSYPMSLIPASPRESLDIEIGSFLLRKTTRVPDSLYAAVRATELFEREDYYRVFGALRRAVSERDESSIMLTSKELGEILDNIWARSESIHRGVRLAEAAMNVTIGVVGAAVGSVPGLLVAMGIAAGDRLSTQMIPKASETLVRSFYRSHVGIIYEFRRQHGLLPASGGAQH